MKTFLTTYGVALLFCVAIFIVEPPPIDIWWHLQIGKDIILHGVWPSPDIYSYTSNREWVVHSWLADVFFYVVVSTASSWRLNEDVVLNFLRIVIQTGTVLCIFAYVRRKYANLSMALLTVILLCILLWHREIRPFLFSPILFFYFYTLTRKCAPDRMDWLLFPLLMALWVNIHGVYIVPVLMICALFLLKFVSLFVKRPFPFSNAWLALAALGSMCTLITPHPISLLERVFYSSQYPSDDWKSIFFWVYEYPIQMFGFVLLIFFILCVWLVGLAKRNPSTRLLLDTHVILDLIAIYLSIMHVRLSWLLVVPWLNSFERSSYLRSFNLSFRAVMIIFLVQYFLLMPIPHEELNRMPRESVKYFNREIGEGNIMTPWVWGGYITWKTDKRGQVFADTRIEPFTMKELELNGSLTLMPSRALGLVVLEYDTEYILSLVDETFFDWQYLHGLGLIEILYHNDHNFYARVNRDKVEEYYKDSPLHEEFIFRDQVFRPERTPSSAR